MAPAGPQRRERGERQSLLHVHVDPLTKENHAVQKDGQPRRRAAPREPEGPWSPWPPRGRAAPPSTQRPQLLSPQLPRLRFDGVNSHLTRTRETWLGLTLDPKEGITNTDPSGRRSEVPEHLLGPHLVGLLGSFCLLLTRACLLWRQARKPRPAGETGLTWEPLLASASEPLPTVKRQMVSSCWFCRTLHAGWAVSSGFSFPHFKQKNKSL